MDDPLTIYGLDVGAATTMSCRADGELQRDRQRVPVVHAVHHRPLRLARRAAKQGLVVAVEVGLAVKEHKLALPDELAAVDAAAAYAREARKAPALTALSIEESRWQSKRYGCFCGTDRHLPTTPLPFEGAWVQCDSCERWCHGECAGMTREQARSRRL